MFRLPLLFIVTGIISFATFHILSLISLGAWIVEPPRAPDGWFRIHLLILDWATMIAMGAVYQLMDVVLQRRIRSSKLGYINYATFAAGSVILLVGFWFVNTSWISLGAMLAFGGIILFAWNVGATLLKAKQWNPITLSTACAIGYLVLTGMLGMAMGLNFAFNWLGAVHERLLAAHIWLGTLGWFGLLITGFSYKMLPIFYLSHGAFTKPQTLVIALWNAGVVTGGASFLFEGGPVFKVLAIALLLGAFIAYNYHLYDIQKRRHKASPGAGIYWTVLCARALVVYAVLLLGIWAVDPEWMWHSTVSVMFGWLYLWGWVAMTILGYLSKIVPFLWWTHKYGPQAGKPNVPMMSDLINDRLVGYSMAGMAAGLLVTLAGMGSNLHVLVWVGGCLLSLFSLYYMTLIARVFAR